MKTIHATNRIQITLLCLALPLMVMLLTIPILAKGISQLIGNPVEPEKLDIRPIPVPVPPPPLASNESSASAAPAPSLIAITLPPKPIAVPTPPVSAHAQSALTQLSRSESSTTLTIPFLNRQGIMVMALVSIILLIWGWFHQEPRLHSLPKECA